MLYIKPEISCCKHELYLGQKVLLFNLCLRLFPSKFRLRWSKPFVVKKIFPRGAVEITSLDERNVFKLNGQSSRHTMKLKIALKSLCGHSIKSLYVH